MNHTNQMIEIAAVLAAFGIPILTGIIWIVTRITKLETKVDLIYTWWSNHTAMGTKKFKVEDGPPIG